MGGLSKDLWQQVRRVLLDCDEFAGTGTLRAIFAVEELLPFRGGLPEANSLDARVEQTIGYLVRKQRTDGRNALVLFLEVLARKRSPAEALHLALLALAEAVARYVEHAADPEALSPEANPAGVPMLALDEIKTMLVVARGVAKVEITRFRNGRRDGLAEGTGWLIAPGLLATCQHVIEARRPLETEIEQRDLDDQVSNALVTFDYTAPATGIQYGVQALECRASHGSNLDYAILRLVDRRDSPIHERDHLRLGVDAPLTAGSSLYIIQHPLGREQQLAGESFERDGTDPSRILYRTPTEAGTSGAPVLNRVNWRVVAMHNGENEAAGLREGTRLRAILADLRANWPVSYAEIRDCQSH
ncbi:MAG: trypsin-like peptidase domain-containing protein [Planctomycetes bacterium]|nr:trypsin-like peptidase domain-containing protein [Planctomycetota bacterium]